MFEIGAIYNRRKDIHDEYGGNRQSGIVTNSKHSHIFLFSALRGEEFGYQDGWNGEGNYVYSGEGQYGDQEFKRGNRAIRDHVSDGKDLHLFEAYRQGDYKYQGQFILVSHSYVAGTDAGGKRRRLIKFVLRRSG